MFAIKASGFVVGTSLLWAAAIAVDEPQSLVCRWKLAGDCRDYSGNGNHGINHGTELLARSPGGRSGPVAQFDGRDDWVEVPDSKSLRIGAGEFSIAAWVHTAANLDDVLGDIVGKFDPTKRRGFNLGIMNFTGVTTSQSNHRQVYFGIDDGRPVGSWTDCGRPGNSVYVMAMSVHDGELYAGTCEPGQSEAGHVYRYAGNTRWMDCGSPDRSNAVSSLAVFEGKLYAGTAKYRLGGSALPESENSNLGGRIYRYEGDKQWSDCGQLPETDAVGGMVVFRGRLYAASLYRPAGFFRYEGGRDWKRIATHENKRVESLCVFNGQIFAGSYDGGHVYRFDGEAWTDCGQLAENTQTYSFAIHHGRLYVGTWPSGRVYRYAGDRNWEDTGRLGEELEVMGMSVYNGKLYAGTLPLAHVFRYDGDAQWTDTGRIDFTPDVKYRRAWTMAQYQGKLFCGTLPSGHVWSFEAGKCVTSDHDLPPGWHHIVAVKSRDRLKLYIDGKPAAQPEQLGDVEFDLTNDSPLRIGFGPGDYFRGSLSDLRIFRGALTDAEIEHLFHKK